MTASSATGSHSRGAPGRQAHGHRTRSLLGWGVVAGPCYVLISVTQGLTRDGFDFTRHHWSLLANGDLGWIQRVNYVLTGLMLVAFSVGLRRALRPGLADRWAPALVGVFGASFVLAGIVTTDPYHGFPVPPLDGPAGVTSEGLLHLAAVGVGSAAVTAAGILLARRFAADRALGLALFSSVTSMVFLLAQLLFMATFPGDAVHNVLFTAAVVLVLGWIATVGVHLSRMASTTPVRQAPHQ